MAIAKVAGRERATMAIAKVAGRERAAMAIGGVLTLTEIRGFLDPPAPR